MLTGQAYIVNKIIVESSNYSFPLISQILQEIHLRIKFLILVSKMFRAYKVMKKGVQLGCVFYKQVVKIIDFTANNSR